MSSQTFQSAVERHSVNPRVLARPLRRTLKIRLSWTSYLPYGDRKQVSSSSILSDVHESKMRLVYFNNGSWTEGDAVESRSPMTCMCAQ
jgi:hypothetical protein